jgi:hypothetical protein
MVYKVFLENQDLKVRQETLSLVLMEPLYQRECQALMVKED